MIAEFVDQCRQLLNKDQIVLEGELFDTVCLDTVSVSKLPEGILYPENVEQVSEILKIAAKHDVKVWHYSTALNWGYGNTAAEDGCFLIVLERMNQILKVDQELAYTVIEPGVTFRQLYQYLNDHDFPLMTDCTGGPPSASVLGNALDRGFGATPYFDHFSNLCGMVVVLADGSVVKTGNFAEGLDDAENSWHTFPRTAGPIIDGLFSQSGFGIIVQAGVWLMPKPEALEVGTLKLSNSDEQLIEAVDCFRDLLLHNEINGTGRFSNDISAFSVLTQVKNEEVEDPACLSDSERASMREKYAIAPWNLTWGLYGSKRSVNAGKKQTTDKLRQFGKARFIRPEQAKSISATAAKLLQNPESKKTKLATFAARKLLGTSLESLVLTDSLLNAYLGIPGEEIVKRAWFHSPESPPESDVNVPRAKIGIMWFVPLIPFRGREVVEYIQATESCFASHQFTPLLTISPMNARTVILLTAIIYTLDDEESSQRATKLYQTLQQDALDRGYQQYRCGVAGWGKLSSINPELWAFLKRIKAVVDPKGILAPGKYDLE